MSMDKANNMGTRRGSHLLLYRKVHYTTLHYGIDDDVDCGLQNDMYDDATDNVDHKGSFSLLVIAGFRRIPRVLSILQGKLKGTFKEIQDTFKEIQDTLKEKVKRLPFYLSGV